MILTPYQARAASVYDTETILAEIRKVRALDGSVFRPSFSESFNASANLLFITQKMPDVPGFAHPIIDPEGLRSVYVDARPYTTLKADGTWTIRSGNDFEALVRRANLSGLWASKEFSDFLALGELPLKLYLNWVGGMASRHLAIDPLVQFKVSALAGVYFLSQHYEDDQLTDERYLLKICDKVARAMRGSMEEVYDLVAEQPPLRTLEVFVEALKTRTGSVRLENVSIAYLFNVVGGSWFGNNARELTAMALDHPPTWISLLFQAMHDRSYRKTQLTQLINTLTRSQEHKDFLRSVELLLRG